jgi:hypothetical protein
MKLVSKLMIIDKVSKGHEEVAKIVSELESVSQEQSDKLTSLDALMETARINLHLSSSKLKSIS